MNHTRLPQITLLLLLLAASPLFARQWTDVTGAYRVEAELVTVRSGKVYLEKTDGNVITVPLEKLSKDDLRHLNGLPRYKNYFKAHPIPGLEEPGSSAEDSKPSPEEKDPSANEATVTPAEKPEATPAPSATGALPKSAIHVEDASFVGEVRRFDDMGWGVESLAFSPDGRFLAVGQQDHTVVVKRNRHLEVVFIGVSVFPLVFQDSVGGLAVRAAGLRRLLRGAACAST